MSEISLTGDQMLAVLEMVAQRGPLSVADAARLCDLNRTVTHRLIATLSKRSYIRKSDDGYVLGPTMVRLSRLAEIGIKDVAKPHMLKLAQATGETVVLHCIDRSDAVVLDQALGTRHLVRVEHTPGSRHPLCRGASGWSILAFQSEKVIQRVLKSGMGGSDARERLDQIKLDGYSVSHDELQMGVHGLACPLFNRDGSCEASIGLLVPSARAASIEALKMSVLEAASNISHTLAAE